MFSFIRSYFEQETFVHKSQFSIPSYLHNYYNIVIGITKNENVGIQINKSEEMNNTIFLLNYLNQCQFLLVYKKTDAKHKNQNTIYF